MLSARVRPIYREKTVLLCDKPDAVKEQRFTEFKKNNPTLERNNQIHVLPSASIEDYYPGKWKPKTQLNGKAKKRLAEKVGKEITQSEFETEMPVIHLTLQQCWIKAFR